MDKVPAIPQQALAEAGRGQMQHIFGLLAALNGKTSPADNVEEDIFRVREGFHNFKLEQVEDSVPERDFVRRPEASSMQLVHFARVMQRTQLVGHYFSKGCEVPLHYSLTGAVILERRNRKFGSWDQPELRTSLLMPFGFCDNQQALSGFQGAGLKLVDTGGDRPEYTQLRISAVKKAAEIAVELRARLYLKWRRNEGASLDDVLVVHGSIADVPNKWITPNFLSLDPRFYLPWQNSELLERQLQVKPYNRGQLLRVSKTVGDDPMPKYMWFVRMRTSSKADPEFGLLGCQITADSDEQARVRADQFTSLILAERSPVSFPAEGWDRLIFPLKLCGDFLASMVPTQETVKAYFARE